MLKISCWLDISPIVWPPLPPTALPGTNWTGRTWLRRPQVGRGRPTPTHRRCISKILWWPNMTLAVDQDCVKTNQYIGDQRSRWKPIDPNALSSSPIYDIVTWPVKVCVISNLLYLKPYWAALYQNFHFKLWCFRKTLKFCNEGGLSLINWWGINHITSVFDQRGRRQRSSFFSQLIIQCCHIPVYRISFSRYIFPNFLRWNWFWVMFRILIGYI